MATVTKYAIVKTVNGRQPETKETFAALEDALEGMKWRMTSILDRSAYYRYHHGWKSYVNTERPIERWYVGKNFCEDWFSYDNYTLEIKEVECELTPADDAERCLLMDFWASESPEAGKRAFLLSQTRDDAFWREFFGIPSWAKADFSGAEQIYSEWVNEVCE
jgi:hypothetical protein